jgi:hypothetical protein
MHPFLQWKNNKHYIFWDCVCRLMYRACNAHASYCHLWPARLYSIFSRCLIKDMISKKKLLNMNCVFWFSLQILSETFLVLSITEPYLILNICWSSRKVPLFLFNFNETRIFWQIFETYSKVKFHENPFIWSRVFPCGQTDGRTYVTKLIVVFRSFENAPIIDVIHSTNFSNKVNKMRVKK